MVAALQTISQALAAHAATATPFVAAIHGPGHRTVSGILWQPDAIVTSEQSLPRGESFDVTLTTGEVVHAALAGRDDGTNVAVLRLEPPRSVAALPRASDCQVGELALAYGAQSSGHSQARVGIINSTSGEWRSRAGGRLSARITLDIALAGREESGPVLNAAGELLGMSTFGSRGEILVIPSATIDRVLPTLLTQGRIGRGWLGLALQPVAVPHALRDAAGQRGGMMIMSIVADGPAARAGLNAGDILLTIGGAPAIRMDKVAAELDEASIGASRELRIIRNGAIATIQVEITARPAS